VARGPSSSVAGVVYNYGSYFSVLVASLEVLYAWMGRSSVGYLIISICGLDKRDYSKMGARWICIRLVDSDLWRCGNGNGIFFLESVMVRVL